MGFRNCWALFMYFWKCRASLVNFREYRASLVDFRKYRASLVDGSCQEEAKLTPSISSTINALEAGRFRCGRQTGRTSALRYWAGWHAARYGIELALPVPEAIVLQFVVDHVQRRSTDGELA